MTARTSRSAAHLTRVAMGADTASRVGGRPGGPCTASAGGDSPRVATG